MKELSIEEKSQRYDEAIEIAEEYYKEGKTLGYANDIVSDIFPELKESEDKRIRKAIIKGFENFKNFSSIWENDVTVKDCLVWLEKQAEQKPIVIIPKFRVGDKIWHKNYKGECMHHIIRIENNNYIGDDNTSISISTADKEYELVEKQGEQKCNEEYNITGIKSKNAEGKLGEMIMNLKSVNEVLEQKPKQEWSEEDEEHVNSLLKRLKGLCRKEFATTRFAISEDEDWLKSLRPNHWKPSDEQMKILNEVLNFAANHENPHWNDYVFGTLHNLIIQLKKLRKE